MADNLSQGLADEATTYQIAILRVEAGMRKKTVAALEDLEADLIRTLEKNKNLAPGKKKQLQAVLDATASQIAGVYKQIGKASTKDLEGVAQATTKKTVNDLSGALGVSMGPMQLSANQASNIAKGPVVEGNPIAAWWTSQSDKTTRQLHGEIRQGMFLGEGIDELARRVRGTKAAAYKDGVLSVSKREAEAILRTAVQSVSNTARLETLNNSSEAIKGIEWVSTLDNRTTPTCRALDGLQWSLPDYKPIGHDKAFPGPIAHWGCRSTQIAVTRSWAELAGKKIPEADTGSATYQEAFEAALKAQGRTDEQIAKIKANQRASMDGTVSAGLDFDAWARKKGDDYIAGLLGPGRYALWKANNLSMRDLTDQQGRELTIAQLNQAIDAGALPIETEGFNFEFEPVDTAALKAAKAAGNQPQILYHGGANKKSLAGLSFLTGDLDAATEYAQIHGGKDGVVQAFEVAISNPASSDDVIAVAKKLGIDPETATGLDWETIQGYEFLTPSLVGEDTAAKVRKALEEQGYDGAHFETDFTPLAGKPIDGGSWVIFKSSQATIPADTSAGASDATASLKIQDFIANPEGQTLKSKWAKKIQEQMPEASPTEQLAAIEANAAAEQAQKSLASKLSQAKKKIVEGKDPTPAQQAAIDQLKADDPEAHAAWQQTVDDASGATDKKNIDTWLAAVEKTELASFKPPGMQLDDAAIEALNKIKDPAAKENAKAALISKNAIWEQKQADSILTDLQNSYDNGEPPELTATDHAILGTFIDPTLKDKIQKQQKELFDGHQANALLGQFETGELTAADALSEMGELLEAYPKNKLVKQADQALQAATTDASNLETIKQHFASATDDDAPWNAAAFKQFEEFGPNSGNWESNPGQALSWMEDNAETHAKAWIEDNTTEGGPGTTQLKQKAFKQFTGIDPAKNPGEVPPAIAQWEDGPVDLAEKVFTTAAEKQAAASKASKLSTAKKKILQGKKPSPSEQAVIDDLTDLEKATWEASVEEGKAAANGAKTPTPASEITKADGTVSKLGAEPMTEAKAKSEVSKLKLIEDDGMGNMLYENPIHTPGATWEDIPTELYSGDALTKALADKNITSMQLVEIDDLHVVQDVIFDTQLEPALQQQFDPSIGRPTVIKADGKMMLSDGNHRVLAEKLKGNTAIWVNVVDHEGTTAKAAPPPELLEKLAGFKASDDPLKKQAYQEVIGDTPIDQLSDPENAEFEIEAAYSMASQTDLADKVLDSGSQLTQLKKKAFIQETGIDPSGMDPVDFGEALIDKGIDPWDLPELNAKVTAIAAEKQAAASLASKLSTAKKKLVDGKKPSPSENAAILQLKKDDYDAWNSWAATVEEAKIAKAGGLTEEAKGNIATAEAKKETTKTATQPDIDVENLDLYVPDPASLKFVKTLSGSTKPQLREDTSEGGKKWVVKSPDQGGGGEGHLRSEATADQLYRIMGARVPGSKFVESGGQPYKVAEFLEGAETLGAWEAKATAAEKKKVYAQLQDHFVMDALLGNWDVAGQSNDNIMVKDGRAIRIDNGGALAYRAMGTKKTAKEFGPEVGELLTMRDPAKAAGRTAQIFKGIGDADIHDQIERILEKREQLIETTRSSEGKKVADQLAKRIDWLESQLPAERTPAAKNDRREARDRAIGDRSIDQIASEAKLARINGTAVAMGTADIEDMQALMWEERDTAGKAYTVLTLKTTDSGAKKLRDSLPADLKKDTSAVAVNPNQHPQDTGYANKFVAAAKTLAHHHGDKQYNESTINTFIESLITIEKDLAAEKKKPKAKQDAALIEMLTHYNEIGQKLNKAYDDSEMPPKVPTAPWKYDAAKYQKAPKKEAKPAKSDITGTRSHAISFREATFKNGFATATGGEAYRLNSTDAEVFDLEFSDGTTVQAMDRKPGRSERTGLALEGTVTIRVPGEANSATVATAMEKLERLGIDASPPSDDYAEFVWLAKTVHIHNDTGLDAWKKIEATTDPAQRIQKARDWMEKRYNAKIPKRGEAGYTADGIANSFGDGTRHTYRADLTREAIEKDPALKNLRMYHSTSGAISKVVDAFLQSGGETTPTTDRIRKGVNIAKTGGWSPDADIRTGGASYFFTRIRKKTDSRSGLYFKARNLARADAITYDGDKYGRISALNSRLSTPADYKAMSAGKRSDETIFKHGLFFLDEIDFIKTPNDAERKATIEAFKRNGITKLPDGRSIESVVK